MIGSGIKLHHPLPEGAEKAFNAFHAMLMEWNSQIDLTAITSDRDALYSHYLDSLTGMHLLPENAKVIDVGTGAGFPGIPLAIARPDLDMTVIDALKKRVDFLQYAIKNIPIAATAVHARAEDYARTNREVFDVAISRAVASLPVLMEWLLPFVCVGGKCVLWKGPTIQEEIAEGERVAALLGGGPVTIKDAPIQGRDWQHKLVIVEKVAPTDARFPRKSGMATKRPL